MQILGDPWWFISGDYIPIDTEKTKLGSLVTGWNHDDGVYLPYYCYVG